MKLKMYQVDAFAERIFEGNPAAVCPLDTWLMEPMLQAIAEENKLSETAFFVPVGEAFELRWFTHAEEIDLAGHATLASAFVLYELLGYAKPEIRFLTRSGRLVVTKTAQGLRMAFPVAMPQPCEPPPALLAGLGAPPVAVLAARDYVAVYDSEEEVRALAPDFAQLSRLDRRGVLATARGHEADFVSRCFFPKLHINEDPVTGSAYCELAPYWEARLARKVMKARQLSQRGGVVGCEMKGEQVLLTGGAVHYMTAELNL